MKYSVFCLCVALTYVLGEENLKANQFNLRSNILSSQETVQPIVVRSRIPPDLVIPSVSSADNLGLNQGYPYGPNLDLQSYPVESLSDSSFYNGFANADFGRTFNFGPGLIPIPAQRIDSAAAPVPFEVRPINSFNPILNSSPQQYGKTINFGSDNPVSTGGFNNFNVVQETTKNASPDKASYSIEQVPEVASIHRTGPFVPSDIPSVPELIKIFSSKSTDLYDQPSPPEATTDKETIITTPKHENSDQDVLKLIQERVLPVGNKEKIKSTPLNLEKGTSYATNSRLNQDSAETLPRDESSTENTSEPETEKTISLVGESIVDNISLVNTVSDSENILPVSSDIVKPTNEKQEDNVDNSRGTLVSRVSENVLIDELPKQPTSASISNNTSISVDISQRQDLNETLLEQTEAVSKLNASSFVNANDILKDTSEFQAIITSPEPSNDSANTTEKTETLNSENTSEPETPPISLVGVSVLDNISLTSTVNDSEKGISENVISVSSDSVDDNLTTTESFDKATEEPVLLSRIGTSKENQTETLDHDHSSTDSQNSTIPKCGCKFIIQNKILENPPESQSSTEISPSSVTSSSKLQTVLNNIELRFSDDSDLKETSDILTNKPDAVALTLEEIKDLQKPLHALPILTELNIKKTSKTKEAESVTLVQNLTTIKTELVDAPEVGNDTVTELNIPETTFSVETTTLELEDNTIKNKDEDQLAVYNSSLVQILDAVKQANL